MATKGCFAPVFTKSSIIACIFLAIIYATVIVLLILFIWIPGVLCLIKQYIYRIQNCTRGNSNPDIPL